MLFFSCLFVFVSRLSSWCFTFKLRRIPAAGVCGRVKPEVPPRRTVPSLLLSLTLGFTKRALCLRWQDVLATDLEKVAKTGCLVRKREAGDVWAPSGTFHSTAVEDTQQSLSPLVVSVLSSSYPFIHLCSGLQFALYARAHLVSSGFGWISPRHVFPLPSRRGHTSLLSRG